MNLSQPDPIPFGLEPRKKAIVGAQWVVTIQLEVADTDDTETKKSQKEHVTEGRLVHKPGVPVGEPFVLKYGDTQLANEPRNVGYLIARAMQQRACTFKPKKKAKAK